MEERASSHRPLTLAAALARLVPPGAGPGAVEAGAVDYVARWLDARAPVSRLLTTGLDVLEQMAQEDHGTSFAALEPSQQDEVLRALEGGPAPMGAQFLRQLVLLALEGSFCHPARGGNRDGVGWRFAGFDTTAVHPDPQRCRASKQTS
jgi:gluconate 2-dehydrogenase gamma chain